MTNEPHPAQPDRRQFLHQASAATAVAATPLLLGMSRKTEPKQPVIGEGEFTYECLHNWPQLPAGHSFGGASHGVALDEAGQLYVTHHGAPGSIMVFDPEGKFVKHLADFHQQGKQGRGHGIDIRREGNEEFIYLSSDSPLGWAKMNLQGELVWQKKAPMESGKYDHPKTPFRPTNVSFGPDGDYYLGDGYGSYYIHRYNKNDEYVSTFGGRGTEPGKFQTPHGQWLDTRDGEPKVVICDRANKRLQYFTPAGEYLSMVEGLLFPADIDIRGDIMVVPDLHARITLYDKNNKVIAHLGDDAEWIKEVTAPGFAIRREPNRWKPGKFIHPHDACFDNEGNIFVAEWVVGGRVTKLRRVS